MNVPNEHTRVNSALEKNRRSVTCVEQELSPGAWSLEASRFVISSFHFDQADGEVVWCFVVVVVARPRAKRGWRLASHIERGQLVAS